MNSESQNVMVVVAILVYLDGMKPMNTPSHYGMYRFDIHLYSGAWRDCISKSKPFVSFLRSVLIISIRGNITLGSVHNASHIYLLINAKNISCFAFIRRTFYYTLLKGKTKCHVDHTIPSSSLLLLLLFMPCVPLEGAPLPR